jgi:hypothetical protein
MPFVERLERCRLWFCKARDLIIKEEVNDCGIDDLLRSQPGDVLLGTVI